MGTLELIVVFAALMALIAVVSIGIDWIGKPLKNRRFISRIYRFEDEKLPVDEYGNTTLSLEPSDERGLSDEMASPATARKIAGRRRTPSKPRQVARVAARTGGAAQGAFSDTLARPAAMAGPSVAATTAGVPAWSAPHDDAPAGPPGSRGWKPGMALDATIDDRKPNLATKAERFWTATGYGSGDSHFDSDDIARMRSGKAPRRTNPRTGRAETMLLTGLRQASHEAQVRMRWPDESIDPWNAQ